MNYINLVGRLTKAPETKTLNIKDKDGNAIVVLKFPLAFKSNFKQDKAHFINVDIFGAKRATFLKDNLEKGQNVSVSGRLVIDNVEKDGVKNTYINLVCENIVLGQKAKK